MVTIISNEFTKFYRAEVNKLENKKYITITNNNDVKKVVSEIFKVTAKHIVDNIGGVFLNRIGFFGVWRSFKPLVASAGYPRPRMNKMTDGYQYFLHYSSDVNKNSKFSDWTMDRTFNRAIKSELSKRLNNGVKYRNYLYHFIK